MPCDYAVVVVKPLAVGAAVKSWGAVGAGGGGGAVGRGPRKTDCAFALRGNAKRRGVGNRDQHRPDHAGANYYHT